MNSEWNRLPATSNQKPKQRFKIDEVTSHRYSYSYFLPGSDGNDRMAIEKKGEAE